MSNQRTGQRNQLRIEKLLAALNSDKKSWRTLYGFNKTMNINFRSAFGG
jgi:hypothetical protein